MNYADKLSRINHKILRIKVEMDLTDDMLEWFEMNDYLFDLESDRVCLLEKIKEEATA